MTAAGSRSQVATISTSDEASAAADALAAHWLTAGRDRDRDRALPIDEIGALARSGLLAITVPAAHGGAELPPSAVAQVFVRLARGDVALAQIAQNHFDFVDVLRFADEPFRSQLFAEVLGGARFGNALAERGVKGLDGLKTRLDAVRDGFRLTGKKRFATGALTADWIPVAALDPEGRLRIAYVERGAEGVEVREDWDAFGQRATFSGSAIFEAVWVPSERAVLRGTGDAALAMGLLAGNQLIHAAIEYGGMLGSIAAIDAAGHAPPAELEDDADDARLAVSRAARLVDAAVLSEPADEHASIRAFVAVDAAKVVCYRAGPRAGAAVFVSRDLRTVLASADADRHWRNSRVHSLHDPARQRERGTGGYVLTGTPPAMAASLLQRT